MRIREIMQSDVITVSPETSLKDVAALLVDHRISGVPVCFADGRVAGVVSEADILFKEQARPVELSSFFGRLLDTGDGDGARFDARTADDAMKSPPITVTASDDVAEAARLMTARHVNRLPVVDGSRLVGIVTRADLVRAFQREDAAIEREITGDVLLSKLWIEPGSVELDVDDGIVVLHGTVETRTTAEMIAAYVRRVPGVVAVESHLDWDTDDTARRHRTLAGRFPRQI
jgi:CBS domain-containing protein